MANEKWTEFTENTDPQSTDITAIVVDADDQT